MGGAIKSVVSSVTSGLGNIGASIIKSVAPKAIDMLKNIVGSGFDSLANVAKGALGSLPIVGPLLGGLVDKLAPGLKNLATGGVESLLTKLANSITERLVPGGNGQSVSLPSLAERLPQILQQSTSAASTTSSSAAASSSGQTSSSANIPTYKTSEGGMPTPPKDWSNQAQVAEYNDKMMRYQQSMQAMQNFYQQLSTIMKSMGDSQKQLISNLR